jgi:S-DNA-T family DNA segregation ATPase FtsK/SpoIIIE
MGRKKNIRKENLVEKKKMKTDAGAEGENVCSKSKFDFSFSSDIKRSIGGVILLALSLLILLGFFGLAGAVGDFLNVLSGQAIGWAKFILPFFLVVFGVALLFKKELFFSISKIIGVIFIFISITGLLHWFFPIDKMSQMAQIGNGGGYFGYGVAYFLAIYLGNAGSVVVLLALFFLGIILDFNFSFPGLLLRIKEIAKTMKEKNSIENEATDLLDENNEESSVEVIAQKEELLENEIEDDDSMSQNIAKIKFVEGRDRFVSQDLEEDGLDLDGVSIDKQCNVSIKKNILRKKRKKQQWKFPPLDILEKPSGKAKGGDTEKNADIIEKTLRNFGIEVERGEIRTGPSVTQYSFRPAVGVKIAKILSLQDDLSLALANPIRIEAPIQGKSLFGIEVPNKNSSLVCLRSILESGDFKSMKSDLTIAIGEDVSGNYIFDSLDKMPHLLIAGATNTGKSVCVNSIITALLYQNSPDNLKFIMVDPKRVELSLYNGIPHLLTNVIVDNAKVVNALKWALGEMDSRLKLFQEIGARDILSYNEKLNSGVKRKLIDAETGDPNEEDLKKIPYIVIVIDELADLMSTHGKEVEGVIVRIAQMARAAGIHLILSTQRPEVKVITGLIKANITTRIALKVATQIDSRTILDMAGAEKLLGRGDLLYVSAKSPKPKRVQGVYLTENEVKKVVDFIKEENVNEEGDDNELEIKKAVSGAISASIQDMSERESSGDQEESLYELAKKEILQSKKASASFLQRRLRVGYARAARLLDILEERGIVGPADGAKPREIYGLSEQDQTAHISEDVNQEKRDKWDI